LPEGCDEMSSIDKSFRKRNPTKTSDKTVVKNIVKDLGDSQSGMFATYKSLDDLVEKQNLKGEEVVYVMMAFNTTLELVIKMLKKEYKV